MNQIIYQPISTIKISAKEKFYWVKCPSPDDPHRLGILQSYFTDLAPKILESIQWKINKLLQLSHPHLQSVIDIFVTENCLHIVQELGEWDCATNNLPYTPAQAKNLLTELTPVLVYLHNQGITHGNIAPESIVIDEQNQHILTNFLVVVDLITEAGGDIYPCLRSQLAEIPVSNLPTGQEWDLYSLGVTTIALLTNMDYQHLYDPVSRKWKWESYVDCSEELASAINRLLGQTKKTVKIAPESVGTSIVQIDLNTGDRQSSSLVRTETPPKNTNFYQMIIGLLLFGITGLLGYLIWDKFSTSDRIASQLQSFPDSGTLTVGYVNRTPSRVQAQRRDYPQFKSYLETELRRKYGDAVKVELEPVLTTRAAQNQIKHKKWDVVFSASATNSLVAEDVQYEFIARMSATEDPYRDVCFFVKQDSPINSSKDFTPEQTIALPSDDSPIFTMPLYDLYGKRMRISMGNTLTKIQEKVKAGEADVGVNFCKTIAQSPEFRTLSPNRIIPVGGVFLSPNITNIADRDYIKDAISKAPEDIQLKANYTRSSGVNYTQFRRINARANQLLSCVDFTRNPVNFYCNNQPQKDKDKDTAPLF